MATSDMMAYLSLLICQLILANKKIAKDLVSVEWCQAPVVIHSSVQACLANRCISLYSTRYVLSTMIASIVRESLVHIAAL